MQISIQKQERVSYIVTLEDATLLETLTHIKKEQDNSLSFSSGCRSSVCGSCAMRVNGKEVLACAYKVQDGDFIEPLRNMPVLRDLVVDMDKALSFNAKAKAFVKVPAIEMQVHPEDVERNSVQSDCILCSSCYSACPVYAVNGEFLGPFSLTRVWKYVSDAREVDTKEKIDTIQHNGIWDCTLCNECTVVCPQGISSKSDIEKLRSRSAMEGYMDPSYSSDFGGGFGFDGSPVF